MTLTKEDKIEKLKKLNPVSELIDRCEIEFGTTEDPCEAGYILPDGTMLDFSGKKEGGSPGMRSFDHRDISRCIEHNDIYLGSGTDWMNFFEERADSIRFHLSGCRPYRQAQPDDINVSFITTQFISQEQWRKLEEIQKKYDCKIYYDIYGKGDWRLESGETTDVSELRHIYLETKEKEKAKEK